RRLIPFDAFGIYFVSEKRGLLKLAHSVGYPESAHGFEMSVSSGVLGRVIASEQPIVSGDVRTEPAYISIVPDMQSTLVVPLLHKSKSIGALNVLSRDADRYSERDVAILRQFAAHVATALGHAQLFEQQRSDAEAFETLAEVGRETGQLLDLGALLARTAQLATPVGAYRTC